MAVGDVELAVSDAGSGAAFFWSHGFASSTAQDDQQGILDWDRLARAQRIVRWDARGHGQSSGTLRPEDYQWQHLARDLLGLADAMNVQCFVAGGVSMGAAVALHAATLAPDRIIGLVLVLPPTAYETRAAQGEQYRSDAIVVERAGIASYVERVSARPAPEILGAFAANYRFAPAVSRQFLPAVLRGAAASDLPAPKTLRSLTRASLLLAWDGDPGHPLTTVASLRALLPQTECHIARRPADLLTWTDTVDAFLGRLSTTTCTT